MPTGHEDHPKYVILRWDTGLWGFQFPSDFHPPKGSQYCFTLKHTDTYNFEEDPSSLFFTLRTFLHLSTLKMCVNIKMCVTSGTVVKTMPAGQEEPQETQVQALGGEDPLK